MRYSHESKDILEVSVPFFLNLRRQIIKCPLCTFKAKQVESPRSFVTHFSCHGGNYTLQIAYMCSVCMEVMSSGEVQDHLDMHRSNRLPLTPIANHQLVLPQSKPPQPPPLRYPPYRCPLHHPSLLSHSTAKSYLTPRTLCPPGSFPTEFSPSS